MGQNRFAVYLAVQGRIWGCCYCFENCLVLHKNSQTLISWGVTKRSIVHGRGLLCSQVSILILNGADFTAPFIIILFYL